MDTVGLRGLQLLSSKGCTQLLNVYTCVFTSSPPQDGVWIRGLFLEGGGWDKKSSCLVEANPMQLVCAMPTIHFKPMESKRRTPKGTYSACRHRLVCI